MPSKLMEPDVFVKLANDTYKGKVIQYSQDEALHVLRNALIALNDGKTKLTQRSLQNARSNGMFEIIERVISNNVTSGLEGDEFFNNFVEYVNVALGDINEWRVEEDGLFIVHEVSAGNGGVRRQRVGRSKPISVPTTPRAVRVYEELDRVLSGRIDFNTVINNVSRSFNMDILNRIYTAFNKIDVTQLGSTYYISVSVGSATAEEEIIDLVQHVQARAGGSTATIMGTLQATRKLKLMDSDMIGDSIQNDMYGYGTFRMWNGIPVISWNQRHKLGSDDFLLDNDKLYVIAGNGNDNKFIKFVREGDALFDLRTGLDNISDMTQEYYYMERNGVGMILNNAAIGIIELA